MISLSLYINEDSVDILSLNHWHQYFSKMFCDSHTSLLQELVDTVYAPFHKEDS